LLLPALAALLASGCATIGPVYRPVEPVPPGMGVVYVYRPGHLFGSGLKGTLSVNDSVVTILRNGSYYPCVVDTGLVRLGITCGSTDSTALKLAPSAEEYVGVGIGTGFWQSSLEFRPVTREVGREEIRSCRLLEAAGSDVRPMTGADFTRYHYWGCGYVANLPHECLGASFFLANRRGVGFCLDVKTTLASEALTTFPGSGPRDTQYDVLLQDKMVWHSIDLTAMTALAPGVLMYLGAGYSHSERHAQFDVRNPYYTNRAGPFWLALDKKELVNPLGGVIVALGPNLGLQIGVEGQPAGITLGLLGMGRYGR
jgi:hypothetical protein